MYFYCFIMLYYFMKTASGRCGIRMPSAMY